MDSEKNQFRANTSCTVVIISFAILVALRSGVAIAAAQSKGANPTAAGKKVAPLEFVGDLGKRSSASLGLVSASHLPSPYRPRLNSPQQRKQSSSAKPSTAPTISRPSAPMPSTIQNFAGLNSSDTFCGGETCGGTWPPDPNGDVGTDYYMEGVNNAFAIYDKQGNRLAAFTENQLWAAGGSNPCNGNSIGDPVVLYDRVANRWILTHVAYLIDNGSPVTPFYQCIAVSKTGDPVAGGWWLYPLQMDPGGDGQPPVGTLNDYAKFGIWLDCLYMAANEYQTPTMSFVGTLYASFSRADLYSGSPLTWSVGFINDQNDPFTMVPSNLSGLSTPPPGTPNYFVSQSQSDFSFEVRPFAAGPGCGAGGVLGTATSVSVTPYSVFNFGARVPQPSTTIKLDALDDRVMQKVQYRSVDNHESLWVVHNVGPTSNSPITMQWAQIDVTNGVINSTPVQEQIYAPDSTLNRWMGSIGVDQQGNLAIGYSTSNGSLPNFPSIAYSGRLATDPPNTLPQSEVQLVAGSGSQGNNCNGGFCDRWGDYTSMSVDPLDDCTFWYINEYYSSAINGSSGNWQTRIGSFKFPTCQSSLRPKKRGQLLSD